jgi:protein-S-isoprenylcysteine O-methyltransferase Ste14
MMVKFGNWIFHNRNGLFPLFYLLLFVPSPEVLDNPLYAMIAGFAVAALGQSIRVFTIGLAYIIRGGKDRRIYAEELVTTGVFAHCRNPLYLGNILVLTGLGIASNSIFFICFATPLFLFFWQAIVLAEEQFLFKKFGATYTDYCRRVNRWLPNITGLGKTVKGMVFKWKRVVIREYTATYIWTSGAVLIVMKHFYVHTDRYSFANYWPLFVALLVTFLFLYLFVRYLKKSRKIISD